MAIDGFGTLASIVVICMLVGQLLKTTPLDKSYLPVVVGCLGGLLGGLSYSFGWVENFPASSILDAICVGIVSGLSSSGVYDVFDNLKSKVPTISETTGE